MVALSTILCFLSGDFFYVVVFVCLNRKYILPYYRGIFYSFSNYNSDTVFGVIKVFNIHYTVI